MKEIISDCQEWGRGISLILSKEPNVDFKEVGTHFIVTFKRKYSEEGEEKVGEKEVEKRSGWELEGLTDSQKAILKMIKANPYTSKKKCPKIWELEPVPSTKIYRL